MPPFDCQFYEHPQTRLSPQVREMWAGPERERSPATPPPEPVVYEAVGTLLPGCLPPVESHHGYTYSREHRRLLAAIRKLGKGKQTKVRQTRGRPTEGKRTEGKRPKGKQTEANGAGLLQKGGD